MKYVIRMLAAIPMLTVGISMVVFGAMAFDNAWWALLAIGDFWALWRVCQDYEFYVRELARFFKKMALDAMYE